MLGGIDGGALGIPEPDGRSPTLEPLDGRSGIAPAAGADVIDAEGLSALRVPFGGVLRRSPISSAPRSAMR
jgi:hypothetical protein